MKRRQFAKLTSLSAVALTTTGFIKFDGKSYYGDCETTTDILGPFYRPNSPRRSDLVIPSMPGDIVELSGVIRHQDCSTPMANAKVELWHCSADEVYDNDSDEFRYRGTTFTDSNGAYKFRTQMPVPYDAGGGLIRPAHFHLMVSTEQYQTLVTQIYFQGDPYVKQDPWSATERAEYRRLTVVDEKDGKKVVFDCNLNNRLKASYESLERVVGKYRHQTKDKVKELFQAEGVLWVKNNVYGERFAYVGANKFRYDGMPDELYEVLEFELKKDGTVNLSIISKWEDGKERIEHYSKI